MQYNKSFFLRTVSVPSVCVLTDRNNKIMNSQGEGIQVCEDTDQW
jgi:hypothetical protein